MGSIDNFALTKTSLLKVITNEVGEGAQVAELLNANSGWRGRAQTILALQKKVGYTSTPSHISCYECCLFSFFTFLFPVLVSWSLPFGKQGAQIKDQE